MHGRLRLVVDNSAIAALHMILNFVVRHANDVAAVEQLTRTAATALGAVEQREDWEALLRQVLDDSPEAVEQLCRIVLPRGEIVNRSNSAGGWLVVIRHQHRSHDGRGPTEACAALAALINVLAELLEKRTRRDPRVPQAVPLRLKIAMR